MKNSLDDTSLKLRVWWNTDHTNRMYYCQNLHQASLVIGVLTKRESDDDTITWNASGLEEFVDGEWTEWYDDEGRDIKEVLDVSEE